MNLLPTIKTHWETNPYFKKALLILGASFFITCIVTLVHPRYILNGMPLSIRSVFTIAFLKGCFKTCGIWLYLTLVFVVLLFILKKTYQGCINLLDKFRSGEYTMKKLLIQIGIIAALIGISWFVEYQYGHWQIQKKTTLGSFFNPYRFLFFLCVALVIYTLILYARKMISSMERLFLVLTLIIGFAYAFGLPAATNISWDDQIHYRDTLLASFLTDAEITQAEEALFNVRFENDFNLAHTEETIENLSDDTVMIVPRSFFKYFYQNLTYLPAGTAILICRLLGVNFIYSFLIGRFANVILYAVIVFAALKRLKWGKSLLAVIALFPTNIFLAANYNHDSFLTAMCMLGFSYLLGELQRPAEKITMKNAAIMLLAFLFGIGAKAIYFPLILVCLLLPKDKFSSLKTYRYFKYTTLGLCFVTMLGFVLPFLFTGSGGNDMRGGSNVNSGEQIKFILTHPFEYAKTLLTFIFGTLLRFRNANGYTCHLAYLGHANFSAPVLMLVTAAAVADHEKGDSKILVPKFRITTLFLSFATIVLFSTALYVAFTDVGLNTINGVSPRYLAPVLFPLVYALGSSRIHINGSKRNWHLGIIASCSYLLLSSLWLQCISLYV